MSKEDNSQINLERKREFYGLVMITIPTILMAVVSQYISNFTVRAIAQILIFFTQAIIVKGMFESRKG